MKQYVLTPAMGKRLIAKALLHHPFVREAMENGILAVVAGTTNGYVAEEVLRATGQAEGFSRKGFRRGVVTPPGVSAPQADFPGDVVLVKGQWQKGREIFDFVNDMKAGDVILKGANVVDLLLRKAAVYIGHPMGGTIGAAVPAVIGRRVRLIVPVGVEKRTHEDIDSLVADVNDPDTEGPRLMPIPGDIFTELDAIPLLTGAVARLMGGGGVYGAEGAVWIGVQGEPEELQAAQQLLASLKGEPACEG